MKTIKEFLAILNKYRTSIFFFIPVVWVSALVYRNFTELKNPGFWVVSLICFSLLGISFLNERMKVNREQLKRIRDRRQELENKVDHDSRNIFAIIQLGLSELKEFYTFNKMQARISFWISVGAVVAGLLFLLFGISLVYKKEAYIPTLVLSGVTSALLEFFGASCFFLYKKSTEQANISFNQLIKDQYILICRKISEEMPDREKRMEMEDKIIVALLEKI